MYLGNKGILLPEKLSKYLAMSTLCLTGRARVRISIFLTASCGNQQYADCAHTTETETAGVHSECPLDFLSITSFQFILKKETGSN